MLMILPKSLIGGSDGKISDSISGSAGREEALDHPVVRRVTGQHFSKVLALGAVPVVHDLRKNRGPGRDLIPACDMRCMEGSTTVLAAPGVHIGVQSTRNTRSTRSTRREKRRPDGKVPGLQRFFVAWEADALPTELFPLNNLRPVATPGVQIGVHLRMASRSTTMIRGTSARKQPTRLN